MSITTLAVRRPIATTMAFIALSVLGGVSYYLLPVQLIPNLVFPQLQVVVTMPSASPKQVEDELVIPTEGALSALEGVETIYSSIGPGFGAIMVSFDFGTDMRYAYLKLEQKAAALRKEFPEQARINVRRWDTSQFTNILMQVVVGGPGDVDRLRNLAEEKIAPRLGAVDGIVDVQVFGGRQYAVEVTVDEDKCEALGVPISLVSRKIASANRRTEYLGHVDHEDRRYFVSMSPRLTRLGEIRDIPITSDGRVLLNHVADVRFGRKDEDRISRIDGNPAVMIAIRKDDAANMLRVAKRMHKEIDRLNAELAGASVRITPVFDAGKTISDSIQRVEKLALFGVSLSLGVLLIFLKRLRTVSIILVAIPVSLLLTFNVMYFADLTINLLSLLGFAFAMGLLVDNGVVVIENTFQHAERTKDGQEAAIQATEEVRMPIVAMTLTTLIAFLPIFFLVENEFRLIITELVYSVACPLIVSVFVSLTLIPMMAARTIDTRQVRRRTYNPFMEMYTVVLKGVLRVRGMAIVLTILLFLFTLAVCLPSLLYMTSFREAEDRIDCEIDFKKGTKIETAERITRELELMCMELDDVKMVNSTINPESARVTVQFLDPKERTTELNIGAAKNLIKKRMENVEGLGPWGVSFARGRGARDRDVGRASMSAFGGFGSQERIEIRGEDAEMLEKIGQQVEQRLVRAFEGDLRANTSTEQGAPELQLRGRRDPMARRGITMADLAQLVWLSRRSGDELIVPFRTDDQDVDIIVRLKDSEERTIDEFKRMKMPTPDGYYIGLSEVADFKLGETSRMITRRDQQHEARVYYRFNPQIVQSPNLLKMYQDQVDEVIGSMRMPRGYALEIIHKDEDDHSIRWTAITAVACVFLLLAAMFEDFGAPVCVMTAFPLATIGVFWGLLVTQTGLGYMVWIGLIMLIGIVVNDAILTLGHARFLLRKGYRRTRAMIEAGRKRLRPVMMTTATTVLAMLPLAIRRGGESEIWPPFAITVIAGLIASTFFTLIFIPALYMSIDDIWKWLKSIGYAGMAVAGIAAAALCRFGFVEAQWIESWNWRIVLTPVAFFAAAAIIWIALNFRRAVATTNVFEGEDLVISITNLTKVFGADNRLMRDWKKQYRREKRLRDDGVPVVSKQDTKEDLLWKVSLLGLLIYSHVIVTNPVWMFFAACATWWSLYDLADSLGRLVEGDMFLNMKSHRSRVRRFFWWTVLRLPAVGLAAYFYLRLNAYLWQSAAFLAVALILHAYIAFAARARRGFVDLSDVHGIRGWVKRKALAVPIIGGVKDRVNALAGVDLEIGKGMFGLLGPNGAGKTTLMRIICNIYDPTFGCVEINGRNVRTHARDIQPLIGYLPQNFGLYGNFTVGDYLDYYATLNGIHDSNERAQLISRALDEVNLEDRRNDKIKSLSGGMRQRVGIAQTLLHLPKIIVVDEPTAGLDPMERIRFRNLLAELGRDRIVIFSTHITEDVSSSCHDLAVMNKGEVVFRGAPEDLQAMAEGKVREAVIDESTLRELGERAHVISQVREEQGIRVRYIAKDAGESLGECVAPTLEDAYIWLLRMSGAPA